MTENSLIHRARNSVVLPASLAGILLAFAATSACSQSTNAQPATAESSSTTGASLAPLRTTSGVELSAAESVSDVVEVVLPSVVSVSSMRAGRPGGSRPGFFGSPGGQEAQGLGSGVILSSDGLIVTNNHVVEDADTLVVSTYDGEEYDAQLVGTDPKSDLAVLQLIGSVGELRPITIGDSSTLRMGELVLAVGNPFGVGQTVTAGIVSAKGRADMGIVDYEDFIQTDAAINPGNSGGALINSRGELVGINTAILSRSGGYMGIGFAIPTGMAVPIIEALRTDGHVSRGWLGVQIQELNRDLKSALGLGDREGVLIVDVQGGGPADKAGLAGGDVVLSVNGQEVSTSGQFRNAIAGAGANSKVKLHVLREGAEQDIAVALGELQDSHAGHQVPDRKVDGSEPAVDGLSLRTLDDDLRRRLRVPSSVEGVVVTKVEPGSKAAEARLRPGDVILEIDRRPVKSASEAHRAYKAGDGSRLLLIYRRGAKTYVVLK